MTITRVGIIGSGIMGSGIAQVAATSGFEVVLRSRKQESADATVAASSFDVAVPLFVLAAAAAVIGGLGGIGKAIAGAVLVALVQAAAVQWVSSRYSVSIVFVLLFVVLMLRPQGLLGAARAAERV